MAGLWDTGLWDTGLWDGSGAATGPIAGGGDGGRWKGPKEPEYRVHPEFADRPKKKKRRVTEEGPQVIIAGEPEIQTGIIEVTPARDVLGELQKKQAEAEKARLKRLRAIAAADDEWLMVA